jgi:hypothetical protein
MDSKAKDKKNLGLTQQKLSLKYCKTELKGSDQRENRGVWSNINTMYLVWRCGDGRSFALQ